MRLFYGFLVISISFYLAACSLLSPVKNQSTNTYNLTAVSDYQAKTKSAHTLLIMSPTASPAYASANMIYMIKAYQLNEFAKHRWVAPPTQMIMPLLIQSLRNTGYFHAVVGTPFAGNTDFRLDTQLLQLQQDFTMQPSYLKMKVKAQLLNGNNKIIFDRVFAVDIQAASDNPYGGVVAANKALQIILQQIAEFCVQYASHK